MADKPPDPAELARFAEQAEKAIERLESRVGRRASKTVTDAIRPVIVEITRLWVAQFGSVTATADPARVAVLMQAVRVLLAGLAADPSVPVSAVLDDALALGARNAFGLLGRVDVDLVPSAVLVDAVDAMADIVSEARDAAVERLGGTVTATTDTDWTREARWRTGMGWSRCSGISPGPSTVLTRRRSGLWSGRCRREPNR